jgi:hypothetical protein
VRDHFIRCAAGEADPRPLLSRTHEGRAGAYLVASLVPATLLAILIVLLWGVDADGPGRGSAVRTTVVYAVALFLFLVTVLGSLRARVRSRALPWTPGLYLFPGAFVDATTADLVVLPMTMFVSARDVHVGHGHSILELSFEGGEVARIPRAAGDEPFDAAVLKAARDRLARALLRGNRSMVARLDPLALPDDDTDVRGGYRAAKRSAMAVEGPVARRVGRWLDSPLRTSLVLTLAATAALAGYVLPSVALARARASHSAGALRRVAETWPYAWVQRSAGLKLRSVEEIMSEVAPTLRDRATVERGMTELLRVAKDHEDHVVPAFVELVRSDTGAGPDIQPDQRRRISVAVQRALALPHEAFALDSREGRPLGDDGHLSILCRTRPSTRTFGPPSDPFAGFLLACRVIFVVEGSDHVLADAVVEPSSSLDEKLRAPYADAGADDTTKPPASTRADLEAHARHAMMESAIDALQAALHEAVYGR